MNLRDWSWSMGGEVGSEVSLPASLAGAAYGVPGISLWCWGWDEATSGVGCSIMGRSVEPTGDWEKHRHVVYFPKKKKPLTLLFIYFFPLELSMISFLFEIRPHLHKFFPLNDTVSFPFCPHAL